jgi:hypothetical protein
MSLSWTAWTMIAGGGFVLLGVFILWRTSDWDLKGAALESAWTVLRRNRTPANPTALEKRLREITAQATLPRRARRTAVTVGRHFAAQAVGLAALVLIAIASFCSPLASGRTDARGCGTRHMRIHAAERRASEIRAEETA